MSDEDDREQDVPTPSLDGGDDAPDDLGEGGGLNAKKIILFFVLPLFILAGVGGGLYFTGKLDGLLGGGGGAEEHADAGHAKKKSDGHGGGHDDGHGGYDAGAYFLEIPNMVVNLSGEDGQPRYLRLSVQLELSSTSDQQAVEAVMPRVVDQFQTYLRELRIRDLRGSQGIYRLQMELLSRVNAAAYPVEVKDVLFQEILIQ